MRIKRPPKRRLENQLRYAAQGIAAGVIASLVLISGTIMIVRLRIGRSIGHTVPLGFVLFTAILIFIIYRLMREPPYREDETRRSPQSVTRGAVTELPKDDTTKSA
jgi:hypothetical protein